MSNKQIIKKVFDEEFDSKKMKQQILSNYERKEKKKMIKIIKYAIVPVCFILALFIGISLNKENDILENAEETIGTMKVYAYTMNDAEKLEKTELKDNVKLGLASYNLAMSSVIGYPIIFELDNVDYLKIDVTNGNIFESDSETDGVKSIGSSYQLSHNGTLYFSTSVDTNVKIKGIKNEKEVFEKNIIFSADDDFNYYATIK